MVELISVKDVESMLLQATRHEMSVTERLDAKVASRKNLFQRLDRLDALRAQISAQAVATSVIGCGLISSASATASSISSAVEKLDLEQVRVNDTLQVAEQVAELKACVSGVTGSMGAPQDWEKAAGYLSRASKIPEEIVSGLFAEQIVPTAEVPDPPAVTLSNASKSLLVLFLREFEKAAKDGNGGKITRFFKLFPLIGKAEHGLDVYGRYVCQGVALRARTSLDTGSEVTQHRQGLFYANALTKLFEHIAQIIEYHGGLVEHHYGVGSMIRIIERLQIEADVQGGIILETWNDDRSLERKLIDIRSYAFTFLVQSFLPIPPAKPGISRVESPSTTRTTAAETQASDEDLTDLKDIDSLLNEIAVMLSRWSSYSDFIASKCRTHNQSLHDTQVDNQLIDDLHEGCETPYLIANSNLQRKIDDRLIAPFNSMTTFYFRRSVEKAFQIDEPPVELALDHTKTLSSEHPYITSAVDDVMYIVDQTVERSLSTCQRIVVTSVLPTIARVLSSDFIGMIQRKMRDESYPRAPSQGRVPPEQTTIAFLILLNNLDTAIEYVKRIVQSRVSWPPNADSIASSGLAAKFPFQRDVQSVSGALRSLQSAFETKALELISDGVFVLFKNVLKPRLRLLLADTFRDVDYQMTRRELEKAANTAGTYENIDVSPIDAVALQFSDGWKSVITPCNKLLTERNFEKVLAQISHYLGDVLEKRIWSYYGRLNELGGIRLERDIASIATTVVKDGKYALRDSFARCLQICSVINMEEDEFCELTVLDAHSKTETSEWVITRDERARARSMLLRGQV